MRAEQMLHPLQSISKMLVGRLTMPWQADGKRQSLLEPEEVY